MRAIYIITESLVNETWFNTVVYGAVKHNIIITCKCKIEINLNFWNKLFMFISSDSCHKKMLSESMNIPLSVQKFISKYL